jgi:hypothetical protein
MPLGKQKIIQPILITLWHVQSRGIALHTPEDQLGRHLVLLTPIFPHLCCGGIDAVPHPRDLPEKGGNQQNMG